MPFKVQINYRYSDEGIHKGDEDLIHTFAQVKFEILETLQAIRQQSIDKACITIEYIPLKKEE